eukprot:scaffold21332_cov57-Phaeocystis_antarctica.AAC.5
MRFHTVSGDAATSCTANARPPLPLALATCRVTARPAARAVSSEPVSDTCGFAEANGGFTPPFMCGLLASAARPARSCSSRHSSNRMAVPAR